MWGKECQEALFLFSLHLWRDYTCRYLALSIMPYLLQEEKERQKKFTVINLTTSSQGKPKFSDIHNKLSSLQQQKLQVLHTELKSLAL